MGILEDLQGQMKLAVAEFNSTGDMTKIQVVSDARKKATAELAKVEANKLLKESEELAGKREALEGQILAAVKALGLDKLIHDLKCKGFNYWIETSYPVAGQPDVKQLLSAKLVPNQVVKTKTGSGEGAGRRGGLQDDYDAVVEKYRVVNPNIDVEFAAALEKDKTVTNQSFSYNVKKKVQKWGIDQGLIKPAK